MFASQPLLTFFMLKISTIVRFLTVLFFIRGTVCQYDGIYRTEPYCRPLFTPVINSAMGLCTFPCLLLSHEQPSKIIFLWEPDGTLCKTGHCRRGSCQGTASYGEIKRIKRDLASSVTSSQRNNSYAVYTHLNRTAGAPNTAASKRQRLERRRRQMWFDCECASRKGLFRDTSTSQGVFGSGSRGRTGKRRKVGCTIICMFLIARYKRDKSWLSLFEANSSSTGSGGIANASAASGGNGGLHGLSGSSATGSTGFGSTSVSVLSSTGLSGSNTHNPDGANVESGGGVRNTAIGVGSGSSTGVNNTSLTGSRLRISNGGLSNESVRNPDPSATTGTGSLSDAAGGAVSTTAAGDGIGSSGSSRGVAAIGGSAVPGSEGATIAIAGGGGIGINTDTGSNHRSNGGRSNAPSNEPGTSASGGTPNGTGIGGSATVPGSSTGNSGTEAISTRLSTPGSGVSSTAAAESGRVLTILSPGGAISGVTGSLREGGESNGAIVSGSGMSRGSTGSGTVSSSISGTSNGASSRAVLSEGIGAGGNDAGIGVHSVGNGRIETTSNGFTRESGTPLSFGTVAVGGAAGTFSSSVGSNRALGTDTSSLSSSVGVLHSRGAPSSSPPTSGNNASSTDTIRTSVVTGAVSPGSEAVGVGSRGNDGIGISNTGLPGGSWGVPVRNVVGGGAGTGIASVGGVGNIPSAVFIAGAGNIAGSTDGGTTGIVSGHVSGASEGVRVGSVGNPGREIGNSGSSGESTALPHLTGEASGAGLGHVALSGAGGGFNILAPAATAGSSGPTAARGGISNGSAGSASVSALASGGTNSAITGHEEGVGVGSLSNRGIATPTNRLASGVANSAALAGSGGAARETRLPGAGIGSAGSGGGREVGAHTAGISGSVINDGSRGPHGSSYWAGIGGGEGLGAGSLSYGMGPFSFGGTNGGTATGFHNTGGGMNGGTWNSLSGAHNSMGIGYASSRFARGFGSTAGIQPYGGRNIEMGGVYLGSAPPRRNIEIYEDDIFFQD
ncbi:uncharacterized protein LOC142576354 isoform X2 [Dermacentor variabilis]|uniref:uncharacterized protein LOC142576354 isoform X2 n=1 Tax=Dermacentor variabilis TaxID=34621 RepID=UPI003F5B2085